MVTRCVGWCGVGVCGGGGVVWVCVGVCGCVWVCVGVRGCVWVCGYVGSLAFRVAGWQWVAGPAA